MKSSGMVQLPPPIVMDCQTASGLGADPDDLLSREWLLTNRLGTYASASILGTNTRRYHGLLVAATQPPVKKAVTLHCLMDQLIIPPGAAGPGGTYDLASFEFDGAISPDGRKLLAQFRNDLAIGFVYRCGPAEVIKEIILAESDHAVAVRYRIVGIDNAIIRLRPFAVMRDYHALRRPDNRGTITARYANNTLMVESDWLPRQVLHISAVHAGSGYAGGLQACRYVAQPQWWHKFRYRGDILRGQEGLEDSWSPGCFEGPLEPRKPLKLVASLGTPVDLNFDIALEQKARRASQIVSKLPPTADELTVRLAMASDSFIAQRPRPGAESSLTVIAGYHWFDDWGRDAMISVPGLLLATGRHKDALSVLRTFASAIDQGMLPNCFDAYGGSPHYNSVDASLWFVLVADQYVRASGDTDSWKRELGPAAEKILRAYHAGTRFGIRAEGDGLLTAGNEGTQLTWMDCKLGDQPVTPRHGKCCEINALWHAALRVAAERAYSAEARHEFGDLAERVSRNYATTFWNERAGCLYDVIRPDGRDASVRPNQILAVSLPYCPLTARQQRAIVDVVFQQLFTPMGLRTLSPSDTRYRGRFGLSVQSRELAYHQGTAWPWLMGPFIEAHLKVNKFSPAALRQARQWLAPLEAHLSQAGVGFVSEIFEGDAPHRPGGCIAQAWSVAEVLRVKCLIASAAT